MRLWPTRPALLFVPVALVAGMAILAAFGLAALRGGPQPPAHHLPAARPAALRKPVPPKIKVPHHRSAFATEQAMTASQLLNRWNPLIAAAAQRFHVPQPWLRAVIIAESGGRTLSADNRPLKSGAGALGLMQLMPDTYQDMRVRYGLGPDAQDPHDNIFAGAAFLHRLFLSYGYPALFSAYNDGPGNLEDRLRWGNLLPLETRKYAGRIARSLATGIGLHGVKTKFTRPDGSAVLIDSSAVVSVRAALPGEYAATVRSVITVGRMRQGVRESLVAVKAVLRATGGGI